MKEAARRTLRARRATICLATIGSLSACLSFEEAAQEDLEAESSALIPGRVLTNELLKSDYDGDGKADLALYRPEDRAWFIHKSSGAPDDMIVWGDPDDLLVPGDYDGDSRTDVAWFNRRDQLWTVRGSTGNLISKDMKPFLGVPAPGDYDGDRRTDFVVYLRQTGLWHGYLSGGSDLSVPPFGGPTDRIVPADYDGDGKTDLAFFRPSEGTWNIRPSTGGQDLKIQFGESTDRVIPGDYDGDERTDVAIYRPRDKAVAIHYTTGGRDAFFQFSEPSDRLVPADYDGDGKTDVAAFHPKTGVWEIFKSGLGVVTRTQFGRATDRVLTGRFAIGPRNSLLGVPLDFDGDGRADLSLVRPRDATWHALLSTALPNYFEQFGNSNSDLFAPGDYDGDGIADPAVLRATGGSTTPASLHCWYRPSSGGSDLVRVLPVTPDRQRQKIIPGDYDGDGRTDCAVYTGTSWLIAPSSQSGTINIPFGEPTDVPMPGDYDGDGTTDQAVFRPRDGNWYVHPSTGGVDVVTNFGRATDKPLAGDYDGDGRHDPSVYRPEERLWFAHPSMGGVDIIKEIRDDFFPGERFVPRDLNGDNKVDFVRYRDGLWLSNLGSSTNFGEATDIVFLTN